MGRGDRGDGGGGGLKRDSAEEVNGFFDKWRPVHPLPQPQNRRRAEPAQIEHWGGWGSPAADTEKYVRMSGVVQQGMDPEPSTV